MNPGTAGVGRGRHVGGFLLPVEVVVVPVKVDVDDLMPLDDELVMLLLDFDVVDFEEELLLVDLPDVLV